MNRISSHSVALGFERSVAVVIGINAYSHGLQPLQNAVRDASALGDLLVHQGFEVLRIIEAEASLSALSQLVTQRLPTLEPALDRLLIYFAGHGLAHTDEQHNLSGYLLPADARRDDPSSYWPMNSLREALGRLTCRHLLLVLDCCFAGAFPRSASRDIRPPESLAPPLFVERFRHFTSHRSFQLLLSAAHDELASDRLLSRHSQESRGDGSHSPFAHALLEVLRSPSPADFNQDGLISASELYVYLRSRLIDSHSQQTPSLWHLDWHDRGEFLFLLGGSFPALPSAAPLSKESNPYLGLRPFSSQQRHLFFGRERLVNSLLERLLATPLLLLCAPSGAGKSSLVNAGLLPRLGDSGSWMLPPPLRPSAQPLQALSSWLASLTPEAPSAEELTAQPHLAAGFLESFLLSHPECPLLLVVDPLEELMTACLEESLRLAFLQALSSLLHLSHPQLRIVLLLRSDFEPHFLALLQPSYLSAALWRESRCLVPPMNRDELRRCIEKPAESCVLFFSPGLVERLLDDVEQMPGALPLLSVALSELFNAYINSGRNDRTLSNEDYDNMGGGIAGALQRRAELIFHGQPPPPADGQPPLPTVPEEELPAYQRTLRNVLLRMVSPEGSEPTRRRALRSELEYAQPEENARVQRALSILEASRLVVGAQSSDGKGPSVEPAHDALLSAWPRLHDWARHAQRELLLLRRISAAAAEWERQNRAVDSLWADARLDKLELSPEGLHHPDSPLALATFSVGGKPAEPLALNAVECSFLHTSEVRRRALRSRRNVTTFAVGTGLVVLTIIALLQATEARSQKAIADANAAEKEQQAELAKREAIERAKETRKALDSEARAKHEEQKARKSEELARVRQREAQEKSDKLLARNRLEKAQELAGRDPTKAMLVLREARDRHEKFDDDWLQTVLDLSQMAISRSILNAGLRGDGRVFSVDKAVFSPDGSRLLTRSQGGTVRLWNITNMGKPLELNINEENAVDARFSPDGEYIAIPKNDGTVHLWRGGNKMILKVLQGHTQRVSFSVFDTESNMLLTASDDGSALLWKTAEPTSPLVYAGPQAPVVCATFSPEGSHVLVGYSDGSFYIWRTDEHVPNNAWFKGYIRGLFSAIFSPDGRMVLTLSADGIARLWSAEGSGEPLILKGYSGAVREAFFNADSNNSLLLILDKNETAQIWRIEGTDRLPVLLGRIHAVKHAAFNSDGTQIIAALGDGSVKLWNLDDLSEPVALIKATGGVLSVSLSPDGTRVLVASADGSTRLWRIDNPLEPLILNGHTQAVLSATFSPDGSHVSTASEDGTVRIWRVQGTLASTYLSDHANKAQLILFSPDGSLLLTSTHQNSAYLWHIDSNNRPLTLAGHKDVITDASFSPNGLYLLTASADTTARLWKINSVDAPTVLSGHQDSVHTVRFSRDGSQMLTASDDGTVRVYGVYENKQPVILSGHIGGVKHVAFSRQGSLLTVAKDGVARLWHTGEIRTSALLGVLDTVVNEAKFSRGGHYILVLTSDNKVHLRRSRTLDVYRALDDNIKHVVNADFSSDETQVILRTKNGLVYFWNISDNDASSKLVNLNARAMSFAFSSYGSQIVALSNNNQVNMIHVKNNTRSFINEKKFIKRVYSSHDGFRVLTVLDDDTAHLWRVDSADLPLILKHKELAQAFFQPGENYIVTQSTQGQLRVWPVGVEAVHKFLWGTSSACLSKSERQLFLREESDEAQYGQIYCERSHRVSR